MCDDAVRDYLYSLQHVPYWFVTQQQIKIWYDNNYVHNNERLSKGYDGVYDGYKKCKAQKAQTKKELMPIAWRPSRWWEKTIPEDEKKEMEALWG